MPLSKSSMSNVLAVLAWAPLPFFALFAIGATWDTTAMLADEFERGVVVESEPTKGGYVFTLESGEEGWFPSLLLVQVRQSQVSLVPGDVVEKQGGSLVYRLNGRTLSGNAWQMKKWAWPVLTPLIVAMIGLVGFRVVFQRFPSPRDLPVAERRR